MRPSFKGFEREQEDTASSIDPQSETSGQSDQETASSAALSAALSEASSKASSTASSTASSAASSRDTSPNSALADQGRTVQRQDTRSIVRKLVDHFSNSDSDNTDRTVVSVRRRRSKTTTHIELPRGGERELRKKMAAQNQANDAVQLWKSMLEVLKESLDEADQALDRNAPKGTLMGHKADIESVEQDLADVWLKMSTFFDADGVDIEKVNLTVSRTKSYRRINRIKGHIDSLTQAAAPLSANTGTIQVVNQTSFGHLDLPTFDGDYTEFDNFEGNFKSLIESANLDEGKKRAFLLNKIQGEAKAYIGQEGLASKSYEDIWEELRQRFGKPWRITRATVKKLLDIPDPANTPQELTRYWNNLIEVCKMAERRKLTATSLILNMGLLKLPVEFRSKMDDKLKPLSPQYILTREVIAEPFNDVIAGELDKPNHLMATLNFNTTTSQGNSNSNSYGKTSAGNGPYGKQKVFLCMLCGKKQRSHKTWQCPVYNTGQLAIERMQKLGRCTNCAGSRNEHGVDCSHRHKFNCNYHPGTHLFWLCPKYVNPTANKALQQMQQPGWHGQNTQYSYTQYQHQQHPTQGQHSSQGQNPGQGQGFGYGQNLAQGQGYGQNLAQGQSYGHNLAQGQSYGQNYGYPQGQNNPQGGSGQKGYQQPRNSDHR